MAKSGAVAGNAVAGAEAADGVAPVVTPGGETAGGETPAGGTSDKSDGVEAPHGGGTPPEPERAPDAFDREYVAKVLAKQGGVTLEKAAQAVQGLSIERGREIEALGRSGQVAEIRRLLGK